MTIALQSLLYVNMVSNGVLFSRAALQGRGYCSNSNNSPNNNEPPKNDKDKWKVILGRSGLRQHYHKLAMEQIKSGKPVTAKTINDILAYCDIRITDDILTDLINYPRLILNELDKEETMQILTDKLGSPFGKVHTPGVYIFTHKITGAKYVGSSSQLAVRLYGYLKERDRSIGRLIPLLKDNLSNFTLEVIVLKCSAAKNNYEFRPEIVLEQYYLLDPSFNLNTVKVANNPSGSNAKPLFMYNRDKSILYYYSMQQKDFINNLNIHYVTFNKHLNNGTYYLGKYFFSREPVLTAKVKEMSDLELVSMLEKDRIKYNKNKPVNSLSKSILLVDDKNNTKLFLSLGKCLEFLRNKGFPANQKTLVKRIDSGESYHGYKIKFV